ncbi:MAG: hypothetical protein GXO76_03985 [Calditrichaeota bacterium]|nr:hypothetical protein [Calditrichota bacterium]
MKRPFDWIPHTRRKRLFWGLLLLTFAAIIGLQIIDGHLKTAAAPSGIVSFELAGTQTQAQNILASWGEKGRVYAGLSLGLDFLFLVAYSLLIALGCILVLPTLQAKSKFLGGVGVFLAWSQFAAALLDSVENVSLIQVLVGSRLDVWPVLAQWCAIPKFTIVAAGIVYIFLGVLISLVAGRAPIAKEEAK